MKKHRMFVGLALCALGVACAGSALAISSEEALDSREEQAGQPAARDAQEKDCHLFLLKNDLGVQEVGFEAGAPINTFHLFITDKDGRIIKNAQVVTTIIDQLGKQQINRALPFKGGYILAIDHLASGQYRVEAEILTKDQLMTDEFRFAKA